MNRLVLTLSLLFAVVNKSVKAQEDNNGLYSRRYEKLDMNTILASPRLVTNYVDCLLNKKPCPPEGKALKRILPEALRTKCGKCWPSQKEGALKVITALYFDYPKHYQALREKWDQSGEYHRRFENYLRDQSFNSIADNNSQQSDDDINQGQQSQVQVTTIQKLSPQLPPLLQVPVNPTKIIRNISDDPARINANPSNQITSRFGISTQNQSPPPSPLLIPSKSTNPATASAQTQTNIPILQKIPSQSVNFIPTTTAPTTERIRTTGAPLSTTPTTTTARPTIGTTTTRRSVPQSPQVVVMSAVNKNINNNRPIVTNTPTGLLQAVTRATQRPTRQESRTTTRRTTTRRRTTIRTPSPTTPQRVADGFEVSNRFGLDSDQTNEIPFATLPVQQRPAFPRTTTVRVVRPLLQQPTNPPQYLPGFITTTKFHSHNHILNIINRLTTKFANTAGFLAGMLRGAVPQQQGIY